MSLHQLFRSQSTFEEQTANNRFNLRVYWRIFDLHMDYSILF